MCDAISDRLENLLADFRSQHKNGHQQLQCQTRKNKPPVNLFSIVGHEVSESENRNESHDSNPSASASQCPYPRPMWDRAQPSSERAGMESHAWISVLVCRSFSPRLGDAKLLCWQLLTGA
jgi:hypothetical protein